MGRARAVMVQGTGSHVGKSRLCAALCRLFREAGYTVAPFKAQNMSLNAAVAEGGELAWAQVVQAEAAGVPPSVDMNPILLKPKGDGVAQVIVHGRPVGDMTARRYREEFLPRAWDAVQASLERLRSRCDVVVIEGAGSPAEINLRRGDIANMRVAAAAEAPVLLVGDVDRGGVIAALLGTLALLRPRERRLVAGLVVNKFRGDPALFAPAVAYLERRARRPVMGVLPWLPIDLEEEDSLALDEGPRLAPRGGGPDDSAGDGGQERVLPGGGRKGSPPAGQGTLPGQEEILDVAVVRLPRISNFADLDPLRREPRVRLRLVDGPATLGKPDAVVLPGSKNSVADLGFLRSSGLDRAILLLAAAGVPVAGICGGYQMLGRVLSDPEGCEDAPGTVAGLGLLPAVSEFFGEKVQAVTEAELLGGRGPFAALAGVRVEGYEIRAGRTRVLEGGFPLAVIRRRAGRAVGAGETDGCLAADGHVFGTYLHGVFENRAFREAWLAWVRLRRLARSGDSRGGDGAGRGREFARLAAWARAHLRLDLLEEMMALPRGALGGRPPAEAGQGLGMAWEAGPWR